LFSIALSSAMASGFSRKRFERSGRPPDSGIINVDTTTINNFVVINNDSDNNDRGSSPPRTPTDQPIKKRLPETPRKKSFVRRRLDPGSTEALIVGDRATK